MTLAVLANALSALQSVAGRVTHSQFNHPSPCSGWTVAQVLLHAAGEQNVWAFVVGDGARPAYDPFEPPKRPGSTVDELVEVAVAAAMDAWPAVVHCARPVSTPLPPVPVLTAEQAVGAAALDAAVHAWDVAVATKQPSPLCPELASELLPAARATVEPLRGFPYGPPLPDQPEDDFSAQLLRYLGRNPDWNRPAWP